ncbi:MAG: valine--tRNA ligase [Candidatus Caldatribacteriaceae bacterium]
MREKILLSQAFDPSAIENKWYQFWEEQGYFVPSSSGSPFCIVIPPPNVTGYLHMGHALNLTLQDIVIRFRRMQGYRVLWVPGTDHAGIATQNVVERELAKQGLDREKLGREKFLERVWEWKETYHRRIVEQLKKMGASCDWTRERFTMDEGLSRAVKEVFVRLFEEGLIYQDEYIVNWCPRCATALADIEVEYEEHSAFLYYVRYILKDNPQSFLVVATTRPETILGDVALAVNPKDERYSDLVDKKVIVPFVHREIPVIADEYVDMTFGTGVLKVTPAHDPHDFELGMKHKLPLVRVIDARGFMTEEAGPFAGLAREVARQKVIETLERDNLLEKKETYIHSVGHCYRCHTVIEPFVSRQWFVKMKCLSQEAIRAVRDGRVEFVPERWLKVYFEWMENIKDWCISRQIWWGHRIPVFYCQKCKYAFASRDEAKACPRCGGPVVQDEDVLDTWFSSALWPFSTLGWPEEKEDLRTFYPTSLLVTGFDIIFFWVARMIMMGLKFMEEVPFRKVYITPLVRDEKGKKMSKSLGNALDPLEVVRTHGADALRFALAWLTVQGRDINLSLRRVEAARNFMNKLWNVSRFVLMNVEDFTPLMPFSWKDLEVKDRWILSRFHTVMQDVTNSLENLDFGQCVQLIYDFVWGEYCDWYVEWAKEDLYRGSEESRRRTQNILVYILSGVLKMLHPVAPFITEEIWSYLPLQSGEPLIVTPWPSCELVRDEEAENVIRMLQEIIREVRYLRAELSIPPAQQCRVFLNFSQQDVFEKLRGLKSYVEQLSKCVVEQMAMGLSKPEHVAIGRVPGVDIYLLVEGLVDVDGEVKRISKKILSLEEDIQKVRTRMENPDFLNKAPQEVVERERERLEMLLQEKERLEILKEGMV